MDKGAANSTAGEPQFRFTLWQFVIATPTGVAFLLFSSLSWGFTGCLVSVLLLVNVAAVVTAVKHHNWIRLGAAWACSVNLVLGHKYMIPWNGYEFCFLVASTIGLVWGAGLGLAPTERGEIHGATGRTATATRNVLTDTDGDSE